MRKFKTWLKRRFTRPVVTATQTPWGRSYTVTFADLEFGSSADGTLWYYRGGSFASFSWSVRCRRAVRWARWRGTIVHKKGEWPDLLADMDHRMWREIIKAGAEGQENAKQSGLLP